MAITGKMVKSSFRTACRSSSSSSCSEDGFMIFGDGSGSGVEERPRLAIEQRKKRILTESW